MSLSSRFFLKVSLPKNAKILELDPKEVAVQLPTPPPACRAINGNSEFLPEFQKLTRASIDKNSPISPPPNPPKEADSKPFFGRIRLGYQPSSRTEYMFLNLNYAQASDTESDSNSNSDTDNQESKNQGYGSDDEKKQPTWSHRR